MHRLARILAPLLLFSLALTMVADVRVSAMRRYCDYYYVCYGWDGDYCYDIGVEESCEWYDDGGGGGEGGGGGGEPDPVTVEITKAAIRDNEVKVKLGPYYMSGRLEVEAILDDTSSYTVFDETRSGGEHTFTFNAYSLPNGAYNSLKATWHATYDVNAIYPLQFRMLGSYRHSQYNTPNEAACGGGHVDRRISAGVNDCYNVSVRDLKFSFTQQLVINGSGRSVNWGTLQSSTICNNLTLTDFTVVADIMGSHGPVGNDTVAKRPSHPHLDWQDEVFLVNGPNPNVKTVTDSCPGCSETQLDNYNVTNSACSGNAVGDLGHFPTIRLR